jgi:hypothetical protein
VAGSAAAGMQVLGSPYIDRTNATHRCFDPWRTSEALRSPPGTDSSSLAQEESGERGEASGEEEQVERGVRGGEIACPQRVSADPDLDRNDAQADDEPESRCDRRNQT